jgi:hypothetical protein
MMMEMARTHNSMTVKRGYLIFIFIVIFIMRHDRNMISMSAYPVIVTYRGEPQCGGYPNLLDHYYWMETRGGRFARHTRCNQ